ncbi:hypothetical protein GGX14DRAFT_363994 [Mycena pura]|uniref:Uncharacterized protein n=1 Tax=Mycena pura TaxID=153505 RepID=A0AAD6YCV9_9AGAR|nr:hypothetical protein GGX14DRAFT_363994 [Mycena pura]
MPDNVMANFGALDELVQVIYQGMDKFVVLSDVSDDKWNIHLGLTGSEGRWWRGSWRAVDILAIVGKTASDTLLESFAERLAEAIVQGELHVETGERYKVICSCLLTLGPTSKNPMHVALEDLSPTEAAAYAADVFVNVREALPVGSCSRLSEDRPASTVPTVAPQCFLNSKAAAEDARGSSKNNAQKEIKALKAELAKEQQKKRHASPEDIPPIVPRALKGASLANPNKKARKYQAIEFASDEE